MGHPSWPLHGMASKLLSIPFPVIPAEVQVQVLKCRVEFLDVSGDAGEECEECWLRLGWLRIRLRIRPRMSARSQQ